MALTLGNRHTGANEPLLHRDRVVCLVSLAERGLSVLCLLHKQHRNSYVPQQISDNYVNT